MITDKIKTDSIWVQDVDEKSATSFNDRVLSVAAEDSETPVVIYVDSYGGSVDALNSMLAVLDSVPNPIITICTGKACSAGAVLLSHGDIRCVAPYGRVMLHEVSAGAGGNVNDMNTSLDETKRLNAHLMDIIAENCGKSVKELKKLFTNERRDVYFTPQEALSYGLVDHIGVPRIIKSVAFSLDFTVSDAKKTGFKLAEKPVAKPKAQKKK